MYLTEKTIINYLNIIFPHINDWKNNKSFSKTYKSRPDYKSDQLKLIIEFDGYQHYTSAKRILADIKNDNFYIQNGFNVIRIPYFVQMSSIVIKNLFNVDIDIKQVYPHGFISNKSTMIYPADFCYLGLLKFQNDLKKFSYIQKDIIKSIIEKQNKNIDEMWVNCNLLPAIK